MSSAPLGSARLPASRRPELEGSPPGEAASLRFERLLADLATASWSAGHGGLEAEVGRGLEALADLLGTERVSLLEWQGEEGGVAVSRSWLPGRDSRAEAQAELRGALPWFHGMLRRGDAVALESDHGSALRVAGAPDAGGWHGAAPARGKAEWIVPLSVHGSWLCAVAAPDMQAPDEWSEATLQRCRIVGAFLARALLCGRLEGELDRARGELLGLRGNLEAESAYLREAMDLEAGFESLVGRSAALRGVIGQAAQVAPTSVSVLLLGETGTGKELLARAIHARSRGNGRPLVKVNCAALPPSLVESELFGHEKGAFTGATSARPGRFELADGGTLFLDEVGEIPADVQVKLLRVLQDGEYERVGSSRTRKARVRVIAATNRDLQKAIADGRFREDLYYRLSAFPIRLPPLRERREDVPLLVWSCIQQRQDELGRRIERIPAAAMKALGEYAWPGNVRELENVIERALILSRGPVLELDPAFDGAGQTPGFASQRLADVERAHVLRVLEECAWRINGRGNAAEVLGLHPNTLRSRLKKLGVTRPTRSGAGS